MDLQEIKAYLEQNQSNSEVQAFVQGLNPITIDKVKNLANTSDEVKGWIQSQKDSHFNTSLETWKKNNLEDLVANRVKELNPEKTPEQIRIEILEQKLEEAETKEQRQELRNKALALATNDELPTGLVDYFIGEDEETTVANLTKFKETFQPYIDAQVDKRFQDTGRDYKRGAGGDDTIASSFAKQANEQSKGASGPNPWASNNE